MPITPINPDTSQPQDTSINTDGSGDSGGSAFVNVLKTIGGVLQGAAENVATGGQYEMQRASIAQQVQAKQQEAQTQAMMGLLGQMAGQGIDPNKAGFDTKKEGINPDMMKGFGMEAQGVVGTRQQFQASLKQAMESNTIDPKSAAMLTMMSNIPGVNLEPMMQSIMKSQQTQQEAQTKGAETRKTEAVKNVGKLDVAKVTGQARDYAADQAKASREYVANTAAQLAGGKATTKSKASQAKALATYDKAALGRYNQALKMSDSTQQQSAMNAGNADIMQADIPLGNKMNMLAFQVNGQWVRGMVNGANEALKATGTSPQDQSEFWKLGTQNNKFPDALHTAFVKGQISMEDYTSLMQTYQDVLSHSKSKSESDVNSGDEATKALHRAQSNARKSMAGTLIGGALGSPDTGTGEEAAPADSTDTSSSDNSDNE